MVLTTTMESPLVDVGSPLAALNSGSKKHRARRSKKGDRRGAPPSPAVPAAPAPVAPEEDSEQCESDMERIVSHNFDAKRLARELGTRELDGVTTARLMLKEGDDALAVGDLLPALLNLALDGSHLVSLRDLGTHLSKLTRLSLKNCGLTDLDGMNAFPSLQILDLSDNRELKDISDLFHHDAMEVLNANNTGLGDLTCLEVLSTCPTLREADLSNTPLARAFDAKTFELLVRHHAPSLERLNGSFVKGDAVALDDDAIEAASLALASRDVVPQKEDHTWETIPGQFSHKKVKNASNVVVVMHSESDSELTKTRDHTFAGAPLAILRRARKAGEVATSVCSTLDVARKLDGDLRGSAESVEVLDEWRREAHRSQCDRDDAVRTAAIHRPRRARTPPVTPQKAPASQDAPKSPLISRRQAEADLGFAPRPSTRSGPRGRKASSRAPAQAWAARPASPSSDSDDLLDRAAIKRRARRTPPNTKRRPFASPEELVLVDTPASDRAASPAPPSAARDAPPARSPAAPAPAPPAPVAPAAVQPAPAPADPRIGAATRLADADVVALLAQPPKHVRHLRTRDGFRRFFAGVPRARMVSLLEQAFAGQPPDEAKARLEKRLALLGDVLV